MIVALLISISSVSDSQTHKRLVGGKREQGLRVQVSNGGEPAHFRWQGPCDVYGAVEVHSNYILLGGVTHDISIFSAGAHCAFLL